ncbi:MAG: peptide-methionine (S)-S-oxide reductase MsrA [Salinarchaeum sp.]
MTDHPRGGLPDLWIDREALPPAKTQTATFGMGCFWGPEARFGAIEGIVRTRVGYAGGTTPEPGEHSLGDYTEVVQIEYDPSVLAYADLLEVFWAGHRPRTPAPKRQYRSVILVDGETQRAAAERSRAAFADQGHGSVETTIEALETFHQAEAYHQKYELRSTPVIGDAIVEHYGEHILNSTAVARLNGYLAGHGNSERRDVLLAALNLPPAIRSELRRRI